MHLLKTLLFTFTFLMACANSDEKMQVIEPPDNTVDTTTFTYLALGDSYTIGEKVDESQRYPVQLAERLRADSIKMADPLFIARTGWRTDELQEGIKAEDIDNDTFSLVSLLIGVNNQFQGKPISIYETEFEALLQQAIGFAGGDKSHVFVLSIPDYAFTPYGQSTNDPQKISNQINAFNAVNKRITEEAGVTYFDITPISRKGLDDPELVATDGLHPSGKMYAAWVELIYADIKAKLMK